MRALLFFCFRCGCIISSVEDEDLEDALQQEENPLSLL